MTTELATIPHLHGTLDLSHRDREAARAVASGLRDAKAQNTRRAYASPWRQSGPGSKAVATPRCPPPYRPWLYTWGTWPPPAGPLPEPSRAAPPSPTSKPLNGCKKADNPRPAPCGGRGGQGLAQPGPDFQAGPRSHRRRPGQDPGGSAAAPARPRRPHGVSRERAALDLAIIEVLADGGLRRSEAADLTCGDVELWADGAERLTVHKGKNQVEPQTVAATASTARALGEIRSRDVDPAAPVFGLTGQVLANRVRTAAKAAGLGEGSADTAGASVWPGRWWRPGRPTPRCSVKADGSTEIWWPVTPGASRPESPQVADLIMAEIVRSFLPGDNPLEAYP